jgi:hypothetical protein
VKPLRPFFLALLVAVAGAPGPRTAVASPDDAWIPPSDAELPEGYPSPSEPGRILVKWYPRARGAFVRVDGEWGGATSRAFWPLFRHIQQRDIAMTAPVVAEYGADVETSSQGTTDVAFLYPDPRTGTSGAAGDTVAVRDVEAQTVVSIAARGRYDVRSMREGVARLEQWLADNAGTWARAGAPRRLMYERPRWLRPVYSEIQIPIRPVPLCVGRGA